MEINTELELEKASEEQKGGSPIRKFNNMYYTDQYETNMTRDKILKKALDEYTKQNIT